MNAEPTSNIQHPTSNIQPTGLPRYLLGLDFETTGLDFERDRITEIGAVLWDVAAAKPVRILNTLVIHADAPPLTPEIVALTGITPEMIAEHGVEAHRAFAGLNQLFNKADAVVAHNGAGFDRPMIEAQMRRFAESPVPATKLVENFFPWTLPWVDTTLDVEFPQHITTRKLVHLAAEHGFLNPFAHRAVFDVLTMLSILSRYDIAPVMASAVQPMKTLVAAVSFDDREKAKSRGYRWKAETKQWRRHMKAHKVAAEIAEAGFQIRVEEFLP